MKKSNEENVEESQEKTRKNETKRKSKVNVPEEMSGAVHIKTRQEMIRCCHTRGPAARIGEEPRQCAEGSKGYGLFDTNAVQTTRSRVYRVDSGHQHVTNLEVRQRAIRLATNPTRVEMINDVVAASYDIITLAHLEWHGLQEWVTKPQNTVA
jgi:hypothetical protein